MAADDVAKSAGKIVKEFVENLGQGKLINSNRPYLNNFTGALEAGARALSKDESVAKNALLKTFKSGATNDMAKETLEALNWNTGKIAGSYLGASAVTRVATGGGIYKDAQGNTNLMGVPFL